ncbi:hypothetical protein LINPERPRIM_LOCUS14428 [Linum perenne]
MDNIALSSDDCVEIIPTEVWPEIVEEFLLDTMIDKMKKGHLVTSTFSKPGLGNIKNALQLKFKKECTIKQLTNKYGQLRQRYKNFKKLIAHRGIGYTITNEKVRAVEAVWELATRVGKFL